jgi:hypothetical protein
MTDKERAEKGLVKELKYRYAFASGDFNFLGEKENTNYLRALARLGLRMAKGENDKYFTPESIAQIKKKEKDPRYNTTLVNPIYISDLQAPLEDFEMEIIEGAAKYDDDGNFIGNEPSTEKKKVIRAAERRLTPSDVVLGLEGAGGTADTTIPPAGTDDSIKQLRVSFSTSVSGFDANITLQVGLSKNPDGTWVKGAITQEVFEKMKTNYYAFDAFGYITVDGIKYSAIQIIEPIDGDTALKAFQELQLENVDRVIDSWGFSDTIVETPAKKEGDVERETPEAEDGEEQLENRTTEELSTTTANSSILEKINLFRGWVVKDGQVQKDKKGNPKTNGDKTPQLRISDSAEVTIDANGSVSIKGDVTINISNKSDKVKLIENGKFTVPFGTIDGNFLCRKVGLTTLTGCPKVVKGTFDCSENSITSLAGSPDEVGIFIATGNKSLASLSGGPKKIIGITTPQKSQNEHIYDVSSCALSSLDGNGITLFGPGGFNCANNKITSLSGLGVVSTNGVTKFDCSKNLLTSLVGAPKTIKDTKTGKPGSYNISGNKDVTTFPQTMADIEVGEFRASGLSLTSLSFAPKQVYGNFDCSGNTGKKLTNQSIGKDRFKVGGGFEEDAGNRIVKIDGDFITSEGSWKDKTYDINTVFKASGPVISSTDFVPTTVTGAEPQQRTGKILGPVVKLPGNLWYQEFTMFAVAYAGVANLKPTKATVQGKERVANYQKTPGDESAYVELGTSGLGGTQYTFPKKDWGPRWINFSYFEESSTGWASGQPTGAFIVNGKNYGAKTASRKYVPVLYWLKGDAHPKLSTSKDIFVAKTTNPPHAQNPASQAKFINDITIAVPGARLVVSNNKKSASAEGAFIGKTKDTSGSIAYFAGLKTSNASEKMLEEMNAKGKSIEWMITADPGGSYQFHSDGEKHPSNTPRGIPVALRW